MELLSQILEATDDILMEQESLSLFPSEYVDGSPAPADITEVEIEIDNYYMDPSLPVLWVTVTTQQKGGWLAYLQSDFRNKLEGVMVMTLVH